MLPHPTATDIEQSSGTVAGKVGPVSTTKAVNEGLVEECNQSYALKQKSRSSSRAEN